MTWQAISFVHLRDVGIEPILAHMSDPRMADHMPLLRSGWGREQAAAFLDAKEARWRRDGLGHWAILHHRSYAGWGGFEKEGAEWDFGLVLLPQYFGLGPQIWRKALRFARNDTRIAAITFLLPPTRRHLGALARMGARPMGGTDFGGEMFLKFRLEL